MGSKHLPNPWGGCFVLFGDGALLHSPSWSWTCNPPASVFLHVGITGTATTYMTNAECSKSQTLGFLDKSGNRCFKKTQARAGEMAQPLSPNTVLMVLDLSLLSSTHVKQLTAACTSEVLHLANAVTLKYSSSCCGDSHS